MSDNEKLIEEAANERYPDIEADPDTFPTGWSREGERNAFVAGAMFEKAHFRRTEVPEPSRPPVYLAADLWQALGAPISDFDAYYERNGWADTWANVLGTVRDHFRPKCGQDTEGEACVLTAGHLTPHYGPSDVGSSEPVPVPEPQGEPSDAQVLAALNAYASTPQQHGKGRQDAMRAALRAALRAAGGVR
jgi:hypothetical protein